MAESTCKHCRKRIVPTNDWAGRPSWTHQPAGAAFMDGQHQFCEITVATPAEMCGHVKIERPYLDQDSTYEVNGGTCVLLPDHKGDHDYRAPWGR